MRRKSERNKAKGSPEKKPEKPTRKSTRRRGKPSPSPSPSPEPTIAKQNEESESLPKDSKETQVQLRSHTKNLENLNEAPEEKVSSTERIIKAESPEDDEDANGCSVWKVARADASPGTIQKLKLCRQRNTSEASSDTSTSRRKNKWQESGEGVAGEVDSADEQLVSCTKVLSGDEKPNDPSSSYPSQDSIEEVSDKKEVLPETTSANLSDDKPNIDQDGGTNEASCSNQIVDKESIETSTTEPTTSSNDDSANISTEATVAPKEGDSTTESTQVIKQTDDDVNIPQVEHSTNISLRNTSSEEKETIKIEAENQKKEKTSQSDSSSESNDDVREKSNASTHESSRSNRRKHRMKYHESSNSDTPDSDDDLSTKRKIPKMSTHSEKSDENDSKVDNRHSESSEQRVHELNTQSENKHSDNIEQTSDVPSEKVENSIDTQTTSHKPAKVNLKRSFSSRILINRSDMQKEEHDNSNIQSTNQSQDNCSNGNQEIKSIPRKRRWGTALTTDSTPAFSISTDSLKELVPGAKPLSISEVRLSKDDDEDKDNSENEKWHNSNNTQERDDDITQKNGASRKDEEKVDNHIAARRKISIVKDTPRLKSPSPPVSTPTNILLIKNLVRPFTLNQIKELLSRTGTIAENGFWMDRIKSKCYVEYANEDQAFETRQALHGISWPVSNPKRLHVEYATKDDMDLAQELSKDQPISRKTEPLVTTETWNQDWARDEKSNATKVTVVREWDLGKEEDQQHIKDKDRDKKEQDKKRKQRSRSPTLEAHLPAPARKFKKKEDDPPPAKLLDDLFRKTKATPCIYWLPLTNEQIVVKEEMRRQHMAEHARKMEEMRRAERNRDGRRRRSPRK